MTAAAVAFVGPGKVRNMDALGTWIGYTSLTLSTTNFIEGTGSLSEKVSATTIEGYGVTAADWTGEPWNFASGQTNDGDHIFIWLTAYEGWDTLANGGFRIRIADDLATDSVGTWYVGPQPGYLGGWYSYVINPAAPFDLVTAGTGNWTTNGNPAQLSGVDGFGSGWKITKSITGNVDNCYMDAIVVGKGYVLTLGDAGSTEGKFSDFITYEDTNRFGPIRSQSGIVFARCKLYIGASSGATNTEFIDSGFTVVWEKAVLSNGTSSAVADTFYSLELQKGTGSTTVSMSNGTLSAVAPHEVYLKFTGSTSCTLSNLNVDRARLIDIDAAVTWNGGQITNSGLLSITGSPTLNNVNFLYGTDSAQLKATATTQFDNVSNLKFTSSGTGHAIELTTAGTYTFDNFTFSGYASSDGSTGNEAVYINAASGNFTINADSTFSVRIAAGTATVTLVVGSVTVTATVINSTGTVIQGANVLVKATAGGVMPVDVIVTIANSGTTATVTHTSHGLATNDKVLIKGASHLANNGVFTITKIDNNSYSYTMGSSPGSSPTGTIKSTYVVLNGTTNVSGQVTMSRTFSGNQPVSGWARYSSGTPKYKTGNISGTVSSTSGASLTALLILDE